MIERNYGARTKDVWDEYIWPSAYGVFFLRPAHFLTVKRAAKIEDGESVLEIGAGYPFYKVYSGDVGNQGHFVSVDSNPTIQKRSRNLLPNGKEHIVTADANSLPFEDESFDVVIANNFNGPDGKWSSLKETVGILKPQGRFISTFMEPAMIPIVSYLESRRLKTLGLQNVRLRPGIQLVVGGYWFVFAEKKQK